MRLCLFALFFSVCAAYAQEQPSGNLVKLNIVALDNHGEPVGDLGQDDLQIRDQGKQYKIAVFHKNDANSQVTQPAALGPHEFSNRAAAAPPAVTLILLDLVNLTIGEQAYARNQLVSVLNKLESADYVYLYLLTSRGPMAIRPLPENQAAAPGGAWAKGVGASLEDAFSHVNRMQTDMYAEDRVNLTYMSLSSLASRLAAFPGRKSIVWISHGIPIDVGPRSSIGGTIVDFQPLLREFSATVDSATISVYPVGDLATRGPEANSGAFATTQAAPVARGTGPQPQQQIQMTGGGSDTLTQMAQMTGGRVHLNNDIAGAIRQATDDARLNYTVGYYINEPDNKFHKIRVNCSRHGVKILAKEGYYAYSSATAEQEKAAVQGAVWSPLDAGEIGLRVTVSPSEKVAQGVHLQIRIDANDIRMTRAADQDRYSGEVTVDYVAYDADGRASAVPAATFPFHMTGEQRKGALENGMTLHQDRPLPESMQKVRVIVFDRLANAVGSVTIPVTPEDRSAKQ